MGFATYIATFVVYNVCMDSVRMYIDINIIAKQNVVEGCLFSEMSPQKFRQSKCNLLQYPHTF